MVASAECANGVQNAERVVSGVLPPGRYRFIFGVSPAQGANLRQVSLTGTSTAQARLTFDP